MYTFLIIGMTGEGKSEFIKNTIAGKNTFVFDVNNEYTDLSLNMKDPRSRYIGTNDKATGFISHLRFIELCEEKRNTNLVFEEATGFFKGRVAKELSRILIAKRHTKNNIFFLFHFINAVPPEIYDMCNYIILLKTNDNPQEIKGRLKTLAPYCAALKRYPPREEGKPLTYKPFKIKNN